MDRLTREVLFVLQQSRAPPPGNMHTTSALIQTIECSGPVHGPPQTSCNSNSKVQGAQAPDEFRSKSQVDQTFTQRNISSTSRDRAEEGSGVGAVHIHKRTRRDLLQTSRCSIMYLLTGRSTWQQYNTARFGYCTKHVVLADHYCTIVRCPSCAENNQ